MTDVDRYLTDEVVAAGWQGATEPNPPSVRTILRAALPGILARHRADVLREALSWFDPMGSAAELLRDAVDEAEAVTDV